MCDNGARPRTDSIHFERGLRFVTAASAPSVTFGIAHRLPRIGADMSPKILPIALLAALGLAAYGCQGNIDGTLPQGGSSLGDPNNPDNPSGSAGTSAGSPVTGGQPPETVLASSACTKPSPGTAPLRRLS